MAATGWDSNSLAADPLLLIDHLPTNSPCVNAGVVSAFMRFTDDLDGNPRIVGVRPDVGAFELGAFLCDFRQSAWTGTYPLCVSFSGAGIGINSESIWYGWDFDGDGELDIMGAGASCVTNTYDSAGSYAVGLYASNSAGEAASKIKPDAVHTFVKHPPARFTLSAVALTNSVALRWCTPVDAGFSNALTCIRYGTTDYPANLSDGALLAISTNAFYVHTNLTPGATYYYTVWVSQNGVDFIEP